MSETDGVEESVRGSMRVVLTVAGQVGQQAARIIAERQREQQQASEQTARELQARYDAERATARAHVAVVDRPEWWNTATPEQVADVWSTAHAWRTQDADVERAAGVMETQARERYGVDLADPRRAGSGLTELREAATNASDYAHAKEWLRENAPDRFAAHERTMADNLTAVADAQERQRLLDEWRDATADRAREADAERAAAREDEVTAAAVLAEPVHPAATEEVTAEAEVLYDSAERRQQLAERLDRAGVGEEACEARLLSDVAQGAPARDAVKAGAKTPKPKRGRGNTKGQERSLSR
jgi:hypothetical protein